MPLIYYPVINKVDDEIHHNMIDNATIHDIPTLVKLEHQCFNGDRISAHNFRHLLTKGNSRIWVYREGNELIAAAIILMRKGSVHTRLYSFAVHPEHQGKGIAARLLEKMEKDIAKKNYQSIILEVRKNNLRAINFYQRQGYKVFGEYLNYYDDHMDAIRMKKSLLTQAT